MIRDKIYIFGILLLVVGLSFSKAMVSISYVILIATWLFDVKVFQKFGQFFKNKPALIFTGIYLIHLIGLLYTHDLAHGWFHIRTKIPILILPLIFSTMKPLSRKEFIFILVIFSLSVVASWGTAILNYFNDASNNFREAFQFDSHIRMSLLAVIAMSIFIWLSFSKDLKIKTLYKILLIIFTLSLIWAVIVLEVMSGVIFILIFLITYLFIILHRANRRTSFIVLTSMLLFFSFAVFVVNRLVTDYYDTSAIPIKKFTTRGAPYLQHEEHYPIESGSPIGRNISWDEMQEGWAKVSSIPLDSFDARGQTIRFTLLRYLNSLHLTKDYDGILKLNSVDIQNIEQGIANAEYARKFSLKKRIYKLLWEYNIYLEGGDINTSSVVKRFSLWKSGLKMATEHPFFGVGTGDVKSDFTQQLKDENSPLQDSGLRVHNQFLTIFVAFGGLGFVYFIFAVFFPFIYLKRFDFLFASFFIVYFASMFWEDSLETQIGVTIFAFFYPFYLFLNPYNEKSRPVV